MTTVITRGAGSAQALGYAARATAANYIEDVFSTYLYTGNGSTQTITNGIDLSTKGGLVWIKDRNSGAKGHALFDTARGVNKKLQSQSTNGEFSGANQLTAFNVNGFDLGSAGDPNGSGTTYASWTFRKQAKFFDVVTYTGNGGSNRQISHSLNSTPGAIIIKDITGTSRWPVWHRSNSGNNNLLLNTTDGINSGGMSQTIITASATTFTVTDTQDLNSANTSGNNFVAYLFAHDAGGFGASGSDNVISCGSYVGTGATGNNVTLGYEPQWVLIKNSTAGASWAIFDTMRGMPVAGNSALLSANTSAAEDTSSQFINPTATGFTLTGTGNPVNGTGTYIYIAIRRGPMRTPTSGTSVFSPQIYTPTGNTTVTTNFVVDLNIGAERNHAALADTVAQDRLRGGSSSLGALLYTNTTSATFDPGFGTSYASNTSIIDYLFVNSAFNSPTVQWLFSRAPGFFDEVCYTGTGSATTFSHNLGAVPELMIAKQRNGTNGWYIYDATNGATKYLVLNTTAASATLSTIWNNTAPTSSVFSVGTSGATNGSGNTYVAYLFATVAGVSKVGSYTGTGTTLQVNCGFTGGARFVLIKRTDSTGDWYVWDSARGIVAGNDPYLLLNSTAAEVTNTDYVDTYSAGFEISSTAPAAINANGGTFIFLAIA